MVGIAVAIACEQRASVGSDTGQEDDAVTTTSTPTTSTITATSTSTSTSTDDGSTGGDPYAICEEIDTTGDPFPDSCSPLPEDSQCLACTKAFCCTALVTCPSYMACTCHVDCAAMGGSTAFCTDVCGGVEQGCDLANCGETECEQVCAL